MLGRRLQRPIFLLGLLALAGSAFASTWKVTFGAGSPKSLDMSEASGQHWLTLKQVDALGWNPVPNNALVSVSAGGRTVSLPIQSIDGQKSVSLERACEQLDFELIRDTPSKSLTILPRIEVVRFLAGHLIFDSSGLVAPSIQTSKDGSQLIVQATGAALSPDVVTDLNPGIKISRLDAQTVQFTISGRFPPDAKLTSQIKSASHIDLDLSDLPFKGAAVPAAELPSAPSTLTIQELPSKEVDLQLPLTHGLSEGPVVSRNGLQITVRLPGIRLTYAGLDSSNSSVIRDFSMKPDGTTTIVNFTLAKPMGFIVGCTDRQLSIRLFKPLTDSPPAASRPLLDKLIVVDPGHGGKDTGAVNSRVGIKEKTLTLQIGLKLAETLAKQGAVVVMSRIDDSYPTLADRTHLANINHADLFLCVHINETNRSSTSGSITFCHPGNANSMSLAQSIEDQLADLSSIPAIGVWYDTKIYRTVGFFVLRNTNMPAVLLELGFISNPNDVKALMATGNQSQIAIAITTGVEHYFKVNGESKDQ